jgi:hypothetical protein
LQRIRHQSRKGNFDEDLAVLALGFGPIVSVSGESCV